MSRIIIAVTPLMGHVNPMFTVAESLRDAGHEIYFNTSDVFRERIEGANFRFLPLLGNANYDWRRMGELIPELLSAATPMDQQNAYVKYLFADRIPDQYHGLQRYIKEYSFDLVMTDVLFVGNLPLLLSGESRPPVLSCGVVAPLWLDPASSIFAGPDDTPEGRLRNLELNRQFNQLRAPSHTHLDDVLRRLGVSIDGGFDTNTVYRLPDVFLQLGAEDFEFPMADRPANLHFTGPILHRHRDLPSPAWLQNLDDSRPIIFVTQGTLANFDFNQLINPTIAGLAEENVQVVVTAGGGATEIISAANAIVEPYISYELILPKTNVFVTNGGYNGVQQAISYGVPVISAGESEDKPLVSMRVSWSGTGIDLKTGTPTPTQIRDAVREILHNPKYADRTKLVGAKIAKTHALQTIVDIVARTSSKGAQKI